MGFELAKQAANLGANVFLVSGPSSQTIDDENIQIKRIISADEMYNRCVEIFPKVDFCIMSAAVSDFKPQKKFDRKIKKSKNTVHTIDLVNNKDILSYLSTKRTKKQKIIGFALETNNELINAQKKMKSKNIDAIVLNSLNDYGSGFNFDTNKISFITSKNVKHFKLKTKNDVAKDILFEIYNL
mgnify:FL=1